MVRGTALLLAPLPASAKSRLGAFRSEQDCSPTSRRREQSRSFKNEMQKHEHDRKYQLNASTAEQHRQIGEIPTATAGVENCFLAGMSHTRSHATLRDAYPGR